jgi:type I restriction enzyme S subunit
MNRTTRNAHGTDSKQKLPSGWRTYRFGELIASARYGTSEASGSGTTAMLRMSSIRDGHIVTSDVSWIDLPASVRGALLLKPGDLLFNRTNSYDLVGKSGLFTGKGDFVFASYLVRFRLKTDLVDPRYLNTFLQTTESSWLVDSLKTRGVSQSNINPTALRERLTVPLPPLSEQQRIAEIFETGDNARRILERLIASKEKLYRVLNARLLFGKPPRGARQVKLGAVATEQSGRNGTRLNRTRLYAVTKAEGMVPMRERVQGATIDRCKIVERGWYAYNPMRINIGSIARWEEGEPVMVSGDYVVFSTNEDQLLSDYLDHLRRSDRWAGFVGAAGGGSVRVRIWFDDLGRFSFPLPSIDEQRRIAAILDTAATEIRLLHEQHAALAKQKRGLMQLLLTGKKRVRV